MYEMFSLPFMQLALISSMITGLVCSYLGVFVILRKVVFVGIALAQISALGVAVAVFFDKDPALFAFIFTVAGGLLLSTKYGEKKLPKEALIGVCFASSWAFAILILSKAAHGEADMLNLVQGNILGTTWEDVHHLLYVMVPVAIIHIVLYRKILFTSFDSETATTLGIKAHVFNFLFYLTLALVVAGSIKVCGVLLTFSFLMIPAAIALVLGRSMIVNIVISIGAALISCFAGIVLSFKMDLPTGPAIVGVLFLIFFVVFVARSIWKE